jgi:hypothetical protein
MVDGMAEWRNGGMAEWRNGRMVIEWQNGGMAELRNGNGMVEWRNGIFICKLKKSQPKGEEGKQR